MTADSYVNVLLGHGDGTFASATTYGPYSGYFYSPALADFDGDGNVDVAVRPAMVFLGNGDGTFQEPSDLGIVRLFLDGRRLRRRRQTRPGRDQLHGYGVSVLRGNGDGSFQPAQFFAAGADPWLDQRRRHERRQRARSRRDQSSRWD